MATLSSSDRRDGETENSANKGDIEESLEKSYLLMKTKLDELEQYNRTLESQLGSIFSSISKTVNKVQSERGESGEEESDSNWKTVSPDSRSDEDLASCQTLARTQTNTNSILHINENRRQPAWRPATQSRRERGDLSDIISSEHFFRELRVSDIGDLKRALLLKKTQRSFSAVCRGGEDRPYLVGGRDRRNENVPIKFQEDHISAARSDLNNNNTKSNETEHNQSKGLASLPPPAPAGQRIQPRKYFTPTRTIKTERSKSTGDNPLHYQFYPGHSVKFKEEVWRSHNTDSREPSHSRVLTLENIIENDDHQEQAEARPSEAVRSRRFLPLESPSYRTLADIKTCKSDRYSSKTQSIDGFPQVGQKNSFMRESSTRQTGCSEQRLMLTSSSSLSPPMSSFSSIYASTTDCPTTEDESSDKNTEDADLVDEFFLFPYEVLDQNFDDICFELSRFSADLDLSQRGHLKAAKASEEWKTLWIYRGRIYWSVSP